MKHEKHDVTRGFCDKLVRVCEARLAAGLPGSDDDHFGFMLANFAPKQLAHLRSVCLLVDAANYAQAGILARTMLEGMGLLYWARAETGRPLLWRAFGLVCDLRLLRKKQQTGELVEPGQERELLAMLRKYATGLLTRRARRKASEHGIDSVIGDPRSYPKHRWHVDANGSPVSVTKILRQDLEDEDLASLYGEFSIHVHWDITGSARYIELNETGISIRLDAVPTEAMGAMALAFQTCIQTFILLTYHSSLPELEILDELRSEYVASHSA